MRFLHGLFLVVLILIHNTSQAPHNTGITAQHYCLKWQLLLLHQPGVACIPVIRGYSGNYYDYISLVLPVYLSYEGLVAITTSAWCCLYYCHKRVQWIIMLCIVKRLVWAGDMIYKPE